MSVSDHYRKYFRRHHPDPNSHHDHSQRLFNCSSIRSSSSSESHLNMTTNQDRRHNKLQKYQIPEDQHQDQDYDHETVDYGHRNHESQTKLHHYDPYNNHLPEEIINPVVKSFGVNNPKSSVPTVTPVTKTSIKQLLLHQQKYQKRQHHHHQSLLTSPGAVGTVGLPAIAVYSTTPIKSIIANGICLTICGVIMMIFGSLLSFFDTTSQLANSNNGTVPIVPIALVTSSSSYWSGIWIGSLSIASGLLTVITGNQPNRSILIHSNLILAIITVATSGFMAIISASHLARDGQQTSSFNLNNWRTSSSPSSSSSFSSSSLITSSDDIYEGPNMNNDQMSLSEFLASLDHYNDTELTPKSHPVDINLMTSKSSSSGPSPVLMMNTLLLVISSLTCLLSFLNFCLTGREACHCYNLWSLNDDHNGRKRRRPFELHGIRHHSEKEKNPRVGTSAKSAND